MNLPRIMTGIALIILVIALIVKVTISDGFSYWIFGLAAGIAITSLVWDFSNE